MKRASSADCAPRAKRRCSPSSDPLPRHHYKNGISWSTPRSPSHSRRHLAHPHHETERSPCTQWQNKAQHIANWIRDSLSTSDSNEPCELLVDEFQISDDMSDSSRLREKKKRSRSCSPTKKSSQYRETVLRPANILVDVIHDLPPHVEMHLPADLRNMLDSHMLPRAINSTDDDDSRERDTLDDISRLAATYRDKCRELAAMSGSEPAYKSHLYFAIDKLATILSCDRSLRVDITEKLWCTSLKPPTPRVLLPWLSLSRNAIYPKSVEILSLDSTQDSPPSQIIRVPPEDNSSDVTSPTMTNATSDDSELDDTITTPKPDITVGISRRAFSHEHTTLLEFWQSRGVVYSDPHATQGDMRFPFFFVEAKGLATNGNLIGAQNQAAGGGACAVRLLDMLASQRPTLQIPPMVFSLTTEGAIHELWIHYRSNEIDGKSQYHMTCLASWRVTLARPALEFVTALAMIFDWGVNVFHPQIKLLLSQVLLNTS